MKNSHYVRIKSSKLKEFNLMKDESWNTKKSSSSLVVFYLFRCWNAWFRFVIYKKTYSKIINYENAIEMDIIYWKKNTNRVLIGWKNWLNIAYTIHRHWSKSVIVYDTIISFLVFFSSIFLCVHVFRTIVANNFVKIPLELKRNGAVL